MKKLKTGAYNPLPAVPIVLVGANVNGKPNYMAVGYVSGINVKPAIVCISLNKKHHTPKGILENGTFSINIPSADYVVETDYCGLVSGKNHDKSNIFTTFYGELETAPMIAEFPITCECRYTGQKVAFAMDTVYFGEIIQVHINEDLLGANRKIDVPKANIIYYSGIENRYRTLGEDVGIAWRIGKQYQPKHTALEQKAERPKYQCDIVERPAQPVLSIRAHVSPMSLSQTIGKSLFLIMQYAQGQGYVPTGSPFIAYHDFEGHAQDVEIGMPFAPGIAGQDTIQVSEIPGGKAAIYRHIGPYDKLREIRIALEQWLQENEYTLSGASYEFYLNDPQTTAPKDLETDIVYPLQ